MKKFLYAGYGEIGIKGLVKIFASNKYKPQNIIVLNDEFNNDLIFKNYCKKYHIKSISSESLINNNLLEFELCISVHWRKKISTNILSICNKGGVNLHPSLLPKYAGCSSLAWALIFKEKYVGYTWHKLTEDFDQGDIVYQSSQEVNDDDTAFSLWNNVNNKGIDQIMKIIESCLTDGTRFTKQDLTKKSFFKRGFPSFEEALKFNPNLDKKTYMRASYFPGKNSEGE